MTFLSHLFSICVYKNKVWRAGLSWISVPRWLGGVICKPEGAAWGLVKTPPSLRARKIPESTIDRLYFISKMPKNVDKLNLKFLTVKILELDLGLLWRLSIVGHVKRTYSVPWATPPWITLTLSADALSVSAFIVPTENNAFSWSFLPDLKPARQLSTCNQWAGIPYRRHFRNLFALWY